MIEANGAIRVSTSATTAGTFRLFEGLTLHEVKQVCSALQPVSVAAGQSVCRQGEDGDSMFLVVQGRLRVSLAENGGEIPINSLGPGDHFGELSLLAVGPRTASVLALTDAELLELRRESFAALTSAVPLLAANLCRWMADWMRREMSGRRRPTRPAVVALVRASPLADSVASQIVRSLPSDAARRLILSDRPDYWQWGKLVTPFPPEGAAGEIRRLHAALAAECGQVLVDVAAERLSPALAAECDEVWWITDESAPGGPLTDIDTGSVAATPRILTICLSPRNLPLVRLPPSLGQLTKMRVWIGCPDHCLRLADRVRLVRRLQGIHAGLALGGGAAWGMAHLGVLRALERGGVFFDRVAGTSIGAIIAATYAAGYSADDLLYHISEDMTPPVWLRHMPGGRRWYLLLLLRLGGNARIFRRYLQDLRFSDLLVPAHFVAVDLISGHEAILEQGDVVDAMVASSALPGFARPILRDGQALLDGGILNNLPVDVLRKHQAQFVVAVDVATGLAPELGKNRPTTPTAEMKSVGLRETLLRVLQVQLASMKRGRSAAADLVIAPDTASYSFVDFSNAEALAERGEQAAEGVIADIARRLADLGRGV